MNYDSTLMKLFADFPLTVCLSLCYIISENAFVTGVVSERPLREIYLKPFQIALKKSNPWALMTA